MSKDTFITERVRQLASAMNVTVNDKAVATGDSETYVKELYTGLKDHNAFPTFEKNVEKIIGSDASVEEKADKLRDTLYRGGEDIVRAINAYDAEFFAGFGLALGEAAQNYITSNSDVNRVTGSIKSVGRNKFEGVYDHTYTKTIPGGKDQPTRQEQGFGRMNVSMNVYGNRKSATDLVAVREHLSEQAKKLAN